MTNPACECSTARQQSFRCVEEAVHGPLAAAIVAGSDLVVRANNKWMSIYRCRACGTHWVEAYASSGMMEIEHYYPMPVGVDDPQRWLAEQAEPLPFRRWI